MDMAGLLGSGTATRYAKYYRGSAGLTIHEQRPSQSVYVSFCLRSDYVHVHVELQGRTRTSVL